MSISTRGVLAQAVLMIFNALLSVYSVAVVVVIVFRPCSTSRISTDPSERAATETCTISQLELFMLGFHVAFATLAMAGVYVAYIGHIVLVRATRTILVIFAAIYTGLAIYQVIADHLSTLLGPLELVVAVLSFAIGVPSGIVYERELRCDRIVLPDAFDSVLPGDLERTIRRQQSAVRTAWSR